MDFRILGPLEVAEGDRAVTLGGNRERALLALLLLSPNEVVSSDRLIHEIWGERTSPGAIHTLRVTMSRLRKALGAGADGVLVTRAPGYLARIGPDELDTVRFAALVTAAKQEAARGDHVRAAEMFAEALGLYRGPPLADLADDFSFARVAAYQLEEARLSALEDRLDADLACGRHRDLVGELETLTRAHPLRERLWAQRMLALYRSGRQAEALRAYQEVRTLLREELGIEPNAALQGLELAILRHDVELDVAASPPGTATLPLPALLTDMGRIFVGRDDELKRLTAAWERVTTGMVEVVLVGGEPGVGKTRLAAEMATRVHAGGAVVLAGRCDEDLGVPYQPFVAALRQFVDHTPPAELDGRLGRYGGELVRLHPDLADRVPALRPPLQSDPDTERYRLFESVAAWLAAVSATAPVLLVLDDLQWAAKPTLFLLRHLVRASDTRRMLILGIYRDTELTGDHPLFDLVADLRREAAVERLDLSGLDHVAVAAIVEQAAGQALDDDGVAFARAIHGETAGNPFFVRELLRHLTETQAVSRHSGRWATTMPIDQLGIPDGVRDVVRRRLSRLGEGTNQTLRAAAVVGAEFDVSVVRAVCGLPEGELLTALEPAIENRLVVELSPARLRFSHALVRATLYESLPGPRRIALHRRVAETIEDLHVAALDDHLPALAHHWARAGAPGAGKAVDYATRAGHRALDQLAHDEAAGYYAAALQQLDAAGVGPDDPRRLELLIGRGEAQRRAGDLGYRDTLLAAADLARRFGDATGLARAALANTLGDIWTGGFMVDTDRIEVLEAALEAVGGSDPRRRARLLATLGLELFWDPEPRRRLELSDEALTIARAVADHETLAHTLLARDYTIHAPGNARERFDATSEVLSIADHVGDPVLASRALGLRFKAAMELADVTEAERSLARNSAVVADLGQPTLTWATIHHRATLLILRGDRDAEPAVQAAYEFATNAGRSDAVAFNWAHLLSFRWDQGRLGEVEELTSFFVERTRSPWAKAVYARILADTAHSDEAARIFDEFAASGFAHPTNNTAWLWFHVECAWLCAHLQRAECVAPLRSALAPYADQLVVGGFAGFVAGPVAFYLGLLAATAADWPTADAYFGAATATQDRIGARPWLARTQLEWARMILTRAEPGDRDRAGELLRRAVATARDLGLAQIEGEAARMLG